MSPVAECNLASFYSHVVNDIDSHSILRGFFGCLANGLSHLHAEQIRHRDIKPENILVRGSEVYLSDFGISLDWEQLSRSTTTDDSAKSWIYCAPEVAEYQKRNSSSDMWSLGCVFLEMSTVLAGQTVDKMRRYLGTARTTTDFMLMLSLSKNGLPLCEQGDRKLSIILSIGLLKCCKMMQIPGH